MKKTITRILLAVMLLTFTIPAMADAPVDSATDALNAFLALTGQATTDKMSPADVLDAVMAGVYTAPGTDAATLSSVLGRLTAVTPAELTDYAAQKGIPEGQVRNAYYRSLAHVLRADIAANPSADKRDVQQILALFLNSNGNDSAVRDVQQTIRLSMTGEAAALLAKAYNLPVDFVKFLVMDAGWNNTDWNDDWKDTPNDSLNDYLDTPDGYDNTPDKTPDDSPDKAPNKKPDNTPDYTNTPDDTPDNKNNNNNRNNKNKRDNSPDNSPAKRDNSPDNS